MLQDEGMMVRLKRTNVYNKTKMGAFRASLVSNGVASGKKSDTKPFSTKEIME